MPQEKIGRRLMIKAEIKKGAKNMFGRLASPERNQTIQTFFDKGLIDINYKTFLS